MAVNRQEFTYAINADTSKAKKQIADLLKSLDNVQKFNLDNFNITPDLVKASHAAEELSGHLRAATNVNTGQLDLSKFNQSIRNANTSLTDLISDLAQGGSAGQAAFEQMTSAIARTQVPLRQTNALIKDMATTLKNTIKWELSSTAVHGLESALSGAVNYAKNLNTSLTNIRIVTGQTVEDMARFTKEANAVAKSLSTTTKSYADASLIYYQQGDSQELAAKKAAITIKAANSSFETSAKEMSEYLTSVWNSYQVGADELERYVDIMANLGAKTATSLEEIAISMQKVAATSNTVGVSMEQVSSIIATVSSVTRESAESIGTSYKTIFARIGDLKLGKADEDGIGLGQVSSQLDAIGVKILDESGNLREMGDIIMDLGNKWQTMNQAQKTAVAQVVAGKRQYTQLMALFENWDMFQANMDIAKNSEGALQGMADIYAESWEAASARVQASMEGIFNSIINDQGLIKLTNFTAEFVDGIGSAIDSIGGLNGILRLTGSILMKTFSKEAGARIKDLGRSVIGMFQDPKKNYQQASKQIRDQLANVNNKQQVDAQIQLIDAKNKLLEVEEYLSATQKQVAQASIADIENQVNKVKELEDAYTELRDDITNVNLNRLGASQDNFGNATFEQEFERLIENQYKDIYSNITSDTSLQGAYNALLKNSQMAGMGNQGLAAISPENLAQYDNLEQRMSIVRQEAEGLRSMMEELGITIQGMPIERLNQMLEKTDWNDEDIQALRNALEQLEQTGVKNCTNLERVINRFLEEASQAGFAAEDIERLRQAFERVSAAGDDLANAQRKIAASSEALSQKTNKLNQSLDRQSMSFEKAVESALDLGSGALDLINGFSAMSDVTAQWGDESLSLADKLGSLLSTILSLGMAVPSLAKGLAALGVAAGPAGWIALAAAVGMGALGVVAGNYEADKKEYQDKQNKTDKNRQEEVQKTDEELSNIQSLMKNYNTLRETYISTGEGQDALAASARALAEAYGLVGANLLIAEGNFSAFEQMIASSTGLDKLSNFYEEQIRSGRQEIANVSNMKSKYYDQSNLDFADSYDIGRHDWITPTYSKAQLNALISNEEDLIGDYHLDTIEAARKALEDSVAGYNELSEMITQAERTTAKTFRSSLDTSQTNMKNERINLGEDYQETLMNELYAYFDPQIFDKFTGSYGEYGDEAPSYLLGQFESLMQFDEDGNAYIMENKLDEFRNITRNLKEQWLLDFISWGREQSNLLLEQAMEMEPELTKNYEEAMAERQRAQEAAVKGQQEAEIKAAEEEYAKIIGTENINENYFDILTNDDGWLSYNDEGTDRYEWLKTFEKQKQAAQAEYDKIDAALKSGDIEKGSVLETLLTTRLENLKSMLEDFNELGDADLSTLIQQMMGYEASAEKVKMITEAMSNMIGKSEANSSLTDFTSYMTQIQDGIDASAKEYEELQTYLQTNDNGEFLLGQDGKYLVKEGFEEKYKAARDKIAAGFISDFTAFDDYLSIYQSVAAMFTGQQFTDVMTYFDGQEQKITNSREVDQKLLNAIQRDLMSDGTIGKTANAVLEFNRQNLKSEKAIAEYETMSSLASSYKSDLSLSDAQGLQSILQKTLDDGTNAWEEFIHLDFDQRQAYLEAREKTALQAAKAAQIKTAEDARTQQESLYATKDLYEREKADWDAFIADHERQSDGTYKNKKTEQILNKEDSLYWDAINAKLTDYASYGLEADEADAIAAAIDLMLTQTAGLSEQMQTLVADFEQFNKTGRVSADVMKKMAEWGIDGSKIKTAQDYLKTMKSIYTEAKSNADIAEQNYLNMVGDQQYDWSDEKIQEAHQEEYAAWQEMMRLRQIEYDTEEQYNTTRQGYLDSELTKHQQILSQMRERKSLAEEEANKTQQLAEYMTAAIQNGNLSEAARVGMDSELLSAWDNAANATERGAIAAQAWSQYATEISTAGEELETLYNNASTALDHIIETGKRRGKTDIIGFNFADITNGKNDFVDYIASRVKDPAAQAIWNEGFESLISHTDISNMSDLDILTAVRDEVIKAGDMTAEEFDRILAGVKDNISSTFEQLAQSNIDAAQAAADAWLTAFNTIKDARQTLLSGGNILDQIAGDPQAFMDLMQSTGLDANTLYDYIISNNKEGLLQATTDYIKTGAYVDHLLKSAGYVTADFAQKNFATDVKALGYTNQGEKWYDATGKEVSWHDTVAKDLAENYAKVLEHSQKMDPEAARELAEQIVNGTADYSLLSDSAADFATSLQKSTDLMQIQAEREEQLAKVEYAADTANIQYNEDGTIVGTSTYAMVNGQTGTYDEYQKLATAIANAQEAKASGESWETLSQADQDLLAKYDINFDNVDESANACATALAACAEAAYNLAMAAAGEGYKYDEELGYHVNEYGQQDETSEALDTAYEQKESAWQNVSDVNRKTTELHAESADFSYEELQEYTQALVDNNKIIEESKEKQMELAAEVAKQEKALDKAKSSYKDWMKTLKDANSTSEQVSSTVEEMREVYEDLFHLTEDESGMISSEFLKSAENAELLEEAIKGNEDAWDKLKAAVAKDIFSQANLGEQMDAELSSLADTIAAYDFEANGIKVGASIETAPFYDAINQMVFSSYDAAAKISAGLSSMGVDAKIVRHTEPVPPKTYTVVKQDGFYEWPDGNGGITQVPLTATITETDGGQVYEWFTLEGATYNGAGVTRPSGGGGGSSGGGNGGGGGSKKKEKKKHKRYADEIERYHKNNETLSRISEELSKIDHLKDAAYGNKHIKQLDAETEALWNQLEAQQALYDEAKKYEASDKVAVARYGAIFDEDGTITNYEEVMRNIVDEYNRAVDTYNNSAQEDGDKERLEAAEQRFEDAKKSIEDYEEAIATANEAMNDMLETQNQISEIETEKIVYKLEFKTEMNERDLALLEYYQEKYSEELDKQDEAYNTILGSMLEYESNLAALGEAYDELNRKRRDGLITDADYAETMQDLQDQIIENLSELNEIQEQLVETYTNTLELAREEVEKTTDTIDSANSALQSYLDIIALSGGETDYKKMATFYDMMNQNNLTKIEIQRNHLNALLEEEDKFQDKIRSGQQLTDLEKEQYQALQEEIQDTRDTLLSSTQEALEMIRATYENTINDIAQNLDDFMAGAAGSLSYLQEQYEYFQEEQDRYVSTAKELYEVSKLNRDIENTLGETTSKAAKEALKALQEKINKQSELNELTEYDIEMNQLQYQLLLARIKLEEAQNAKDVVRLTRDENGNYAYRYTANQDKIDEAAQNYEDILQQINDTTVQRTSEIEQQLLNTMSNYKEKFQEIATDYTLTEEERLMKLEELNNNFSETMQYIQQQNEIATGNLTANQEAIAEHYGVNMSEITASTAGNVNETIQSMIDKTDEYIAAMNSAIFGDKGAQTAWQEYLAGIGDIEQAADLAYGDMLESAQEMGEMNGWSAEQANAVIQSLDDTLEPLESLTAAWNAHNAILEDTISEYESLAEVIQGVLAAVGEIPNTTGTGSADGTTPPRFAKGGPVNYTGLAWVDGTPGSPEYVLNPDDTQNILAAATFAHSLDSGTLSGLVDSIKSAAQAMLSMLGGFYHSVTSVHTANNTSFDQNVHITAEFPNVTDHNEIEEALLSLTNRASQFANQKK